MAEPALLPKLDGAERMEPVGGRESVSVWEMGGGGWGNTDATFVLFLLGCWGAGVADFLLLSLGLLDVEFFFLVGHFGCGFVVYLCLYVRWTLCDP